MAELARRQHGVVALWQLREIGLTYGSVAAWVARGWLHPVHVAVYAVGHRALSPDGVLAAALLACGPGAVLSHRSAAAIWDLQRAATPVPDVSVPRSRDGRPGVRMHRPRALDPLDVTVRNGFPVTTATRTVVDMAAIVTPQRLATIWEAAVRRDLIDAPRVAELSRGRRGGRHLRRLLATTTGIEPTRSELERLFHRGCAKHGLPLPSFNVQIEGLEVDAHWPRNRLVVELDSWEFHKTRAAFERDRARDAQLVSAGHRVMRFTWRQLRGDGAWKRLSAALRRRP